MISKNHAQRTKVKFQTPNSELQTSNFELITNFPIFASSKK